METSEETVLSNPASDESLNKEAEVIGHVKLLPKNSFIYSKVMV